jgi:hypothetical protein
MIVCLLACFAGPVPADGALAADRWTGLGATLALPAEGRWTVDPNAFGSGLPGVLLEGRVGTVDLAVAGYTPGPWTAAQLAEGTALDALLTLAPARTDGPVSRLTACHGAVLQRLDGMDRLARRGGRPDWLPTRRSRARCPGYRRAARGDPCRRGAGAPHHDRP